MQSLPPGMPPTWDPIVENWLAANPIASVDQGIVKDAISTYRVSTHGDVPKSVADFLTWARANKWLIDVAGGAGVVYKDIWVEPGANLLDSPNVKLVIGAAVILAFLLLRK